LFQALLRKDNTHSKRLAEENRAKHRHEPIIARVLQQAARVDNTEVIKLLLGGGVHPDVRVKMEDKAAIEVARTPEARRLLYERGGKLLLPPEGHPPDWWRVGSQDDERQRPSNACLMGGTPCSGEFRGLIVDIFSPTPKQKQKRPTKEGDKTAEQNNSPTEIKSNHLVEKAPYDERHLICHPTVEEMIHTRGPGGIMGQLGSPPVQDCRHFVRWIHLPMNHVSSAFAVLAP
jgi:hypothetical protein